MIRHEVIVRVRPEFSTEVVEETAQDVAALMRDIPGVEKVRFGFNQSPTNRHMMFVVDLTNELALHRMPRHPQHARARHAVAQIADITAIGSYLVGSERS